MDDATSETYHAQLVDEERFGALWNSLLELPLLLPRAAAVTTLLRSRTANAYA